MKILSLKLTNYTRLIHNNIKYFHYQPTLPTQIILGTNGSGKSSILAELSPLPADNTDYTSGGSKEIRISHRGSIYELKSVVGKTGKHSFVKDGEEYNQSGLVTIQRELVEREFGYTQETHDILTGRVLFTNAPQAKRREWITSLSTADYTFALSVYKRLTTATRDHLGAVRQLKKQLVEEQAKLSALPSAEGWNEQIDLLQAELNAILIARTPGIPSSVELRQQLTSSVKGLENSFEFLKRVDVNRLSLYGNSENLTNTVAERNTQLTTQQTLLDRYTADFAELEGIVGQFTGESELDIENLEHNVRVLEEQYQSSPITSMFSEIPDAAFAQSDTLRILTDLENALLAIPQNLDRRFNNEQFRASTEELNRLKQELETCENQLARIRARLHLMDTARDITCPSCSYVWREGFSEHEYQQNLTWQQEHSGIHDALTGRIREIEAYLEEAREYSNTFNVYRGFVNGYPRLQLLWDRLASSDAIFGWSTERTAILGYWLKDLAIHAERQDLERRLKDQQALLEHQRTFKDRAHLQTKALTLQSDIEKATRQVQQLRTELKELKQTEADATKLQQLKEYLEKESSRITTLFNSSIDALRNEQIDLVVKEHQTQLGSYRHQLAERRTLEGILEDLERRTKTLESKYQTLSVLARALSPTEGLIAEQLTGFIRTLTAQLNSVIESIWTVDLAVLPCGMENGELNYKFPLQVVSGEPPRADVNCGSTAMLEIVNFAFRLTYMLYKGFTDYPLYLDEFSASFDEQHRMNAMNFVKQLMDSNRHSQLFFVSHYAANHGAFTETEVLVTDAANIAVFGDYNKHVTMR